MFVVARAPLTALELIELGQKVPILTLGLTELPTGEADGVQAGRRAFIKTEDIPVYQAIAKAGTNIEVRYMTNDTPVPISEYIPV